MVRRILVLVGLVLFGILGLVMAANTSNIWLMIIGFSMFVFTLFTWQIALDVAFGDW